MSKNLQYTFFLNILPSMRTLVFLFTFLLPAFVHTLSIQEKLTSAQPGTYVAYSNSGVVSVIFLKERSSSCIFLEEITVPLKKAPKPGALKAWVNKKAPGHTSWISIMINKTTGAVEEMYSFSQEKWYPPAHADALFGTLLSLSFSDVPEEKQRKIGVAAQPGEVDRRKTWKPTKIVEGKKAACALYSVHSALWPQDGTDLAKHTIEVYLSKDDPAFPFPYWIEAKDTPVSYRIRAIDSGYAMKSRFPTTPLRPLQLASPVQKKGTLLSMKLHAQKYHLPLTVTLHNDRTGKVYTIQDYELEMPSPSTLLVTIDTDTLAQSGVSAGQYSVSLSPQGKPPSLACIASGIML